jgi:hypothetical protein
MISIKKRFLSYQNLMLKVNITPNPLYRKAPLYASFKGRGQIFGIIIIFLLGNQTATTSSFPEFSSFRFYPLNL